MRATFRSNCVSSARKTAPMPPRPNSFSMRYRPNWPGSSFGALPAAGGFAIRSEMDLSSFFGRYAPVAFSSAAIVGGSRLDWSRWRYSDDGPPSAPSGAWGWVWMVSVVPIARHGHGSSKCGPSPQPSAGGSRLCEARLGRHRVARRALQSLDPPYMPFARCAQMASRKTPITVSGVSSRVTRSRQDVLFYP